MRLATPAERHHVRIGTVDYADDLTTSNPIGTKKGSHKYTAQLGGVINLPQMLRYSTDYILLLAVVNAKLNKGHGGMAWVSCGVDIDGKHVVNGCYAEDLRELLHGIELDIPSDRADGPATIRIILQVSIVIVTHLIVTLLMIV